MLSRQIGFQWNNTTFEEECQISGKAIQPGIGFTPVIADVPGMSLVYVDPDIIQMYAPPAYKQYQLLRAQFPSDAPVSVLEQAPDGISHVSALNIPMDAPELEAVIALMADELIGKCADLGIGVGAVDSWSDKDFIPPTFYYDVLASYGFVFKTVKAEQYAKTLIERIVQPIVFSAHLGEQGNYRPIEDALTMLICHNYLKQKPTIRAGELLESFV